LKYGDAQEVQLLATREQVEQLTIQGSQVIAVKLANVPAGQAELA
jgi:hypothetical protein